MANREGVKEMQMYLLLTESCNLKCNFCIRGNKRESSYIRLNDLREIIKNNDFRNYFLMITGGEPSLHRELPEIVDLCLNYFKGVSINTNGVDSQWIEKTKSTKYHVQISVDGTREVHNYLRGNNELDIYGHIKNTIKVLNSRGISYNISTTVGKKNYFNIKELNKKISGFDKMKYWKLSPELPFGCATVEDTITITEWNNLVEYLLDNSEVLLRINKLFDFKLLDRYLTEHPNLTRFPKTNCGNVKYKIYVYPDFTVYPCTCLTDFPLGNLLTTPLSEILENEQSKRFSEYTIIPESKCISCKYLTVCNGGCIGMSYKFYKKLGMGDYRCPLINK